MFQDRHCLSRPLSSLVLAAAVVLSAAGVHAGFNGVLLNKKPAGWADQTANVPLVDADGDHFTLAATCVNSIQVLKNARGTYFAIEVLDADRAPVSGAGVAVKLSDDKGNIVRQWFGETNDSGIMTTSALKSNGRFGLKPGKSYNVEVIELHSDFHVWEQELDPSDDTVIELDTDDDGLPDINFTA